MLVNSDHSFTFVASARTSFRIIPTAQQFTTTDHGHNICTQEIIGSISPCFLQLSTCPFNGNEFNANAPLLLRNTNDSLDVSCSSVTELVPTSNEPEPFRSQSKDEFIASPWNQSESLSCSSSFYSSPSEPTYIQDCTKSWSHQQEERFQELVDSSDIENFQQDDKSNLHAHENDFRIEVNQTLPKKKTRSNITLKHKRTKPRRKARASSACEKSKKQSTIKSKRRSLPNKLVNSSSIDSKSDLATTAYISSSLNRQFKDFPRRTFPIHIPIHQDFPRFYARPPRPSFKEPENYDPQDIFKVSGILTTDLYSPRYTRGRGAFKEALCPLCVAPISRGGEQREVWLKTKCSAYWYHMNFYHGISSTTKKPFSPPTDFKLMQPDMNISSSSMNNANSKILPDRSQIIHGYCHQCESWIPLQGPKDVLYSVPELFWFQHAKKCHHSSLFGEKYELWDDE